ncbi:hypothetical protein RHSIM_Rhsim13G0185700 [Rhododendron simsii]|uniref:Uncharacterized protein n=1 Tax=Rhododendron simsii TaxID=118357 RepID=A0A834L798_RHOSS|nr:hypothetical protein RHSIM_Rhsim13G0185700 [Rhododendron simsii]
MNSPTPSWTMDKFRLLDPALRAPSSSSHISSAVVACPALSEALPLPWQTCLGVGIPSYMSCAHGLLSIKPVFEFVVNLMIPARGLYHRKVPMGRGDSNDPFVLEEDLDVQRLRRWNGVHNVAL